MNKTISRKQRKLEAENAKLREWIRSEGVRTDICTHSILGKICEGCRCNLSEKPKPDQLYR